MTVYYLTRRFPMNGVRRLFACALVVLLAPAWANAQGSRATIAGTVKDSRGTVLARVTVTIRNKEADLERPAVTAPDGTFAVGGLAPGTYEVVIEDPGYAPYRQQVTVKAGERTALDVTMRFTIPDFVPVPDRWRLTFPQWDRYQNQDGEYPYVRNRGFSPYEQNVLKGDLPVMGDDVFMILTFVSDTPLEYRLLPTPSGASSERAGSEEFFGDGVQYAALPSAIFSFEMFKGSTAFKPRDWAFRITPQFNLNYVALRERNALNVSPEAGATRRRQHLALQEAFAEFKLADVGPNYDFVSIRGGIQPFNSDFRGFLYRDTNLGARVFGNWGRNRNQWNAALVDQLEKETNSDLNLLERRRQRVGIANYYRQDFLTEGYTFTVSAHMNHDDGEDLFFDENGFLVRPSPIGVVRPHRVHAYYAGVGGDGHWGRLNVTHQFYQAFGRDDFNGISGQPVDINAQFAAAELSVDKDWYRPRVSVVYASGDEDPGDDRGKGFDAITDNPNIAGGPFSFWQRQGLRLTQTAVGLAGRASVLPSLRSSKLEGQANFVNPGLLMINGGVDAELTTKMKLVTNVNLVRFQYTETLQRLLFQGTIDKNVGIDVGAGIQYRPALNDNFVVTAGITAFLPGTGFKQIYSDKVLYAPFAGITLMY
jgi:hypothetical protein